MGPTPTADQKSRLWTKYLSIEWAEWKANYDNVRIIASQAGNWRYRGEEKKTLYNLRWKCNEADSSFTIIYDAMKQILVLLLQCNKANISFTITMQWSKY